MKTIIAGSRTITDYYIVQDAIQQSGFEITEVVSGGCRGADLFGEEWAQENGIPIKRFPANWEKYGKAAGPIRNSQLVNYVNKEGGLILIWDGKSKGSQDVLDKAIVWKLKIYEYIITE